MIFKSITLHNLFSYYGTHPFDLMPPPENNSNIVIIMGRNGFGKTSFLNSVKLLFGDVTKELYQSVQRGSGLNEKGFVIGAKEWWGILNYQARQRQEFDCYVEAILLDENNQEYALKRSWYLQDDNYKSLLELTAPRRPLLTMENAEKFLSSLLPLDYIPFFFFDAEEIGYLAEANNNKIIEKMEQLLNIRPADNLRDCIRELIKKVEKKSITPDANLKLAKSENRHEELQIQQLNLNSKYQSIEFDIETLDIDIREIRQKINLFSGQGAIENNAKLEASKNSELKNLEESLNGLSEMFGGDAFLRLNAKLMQKTMPAIDRCAHGLRGATSEMLESLREPLKEVFITPPYPNNQRLSDAQIVFYQRRIIKLLDSRDVEEDDDKLFELAPARAKKLLATLSAYAPRHSPETTLSDGLANALQADQQLTEIDKSLLEVRQLSDENKLQFQQLQAEESRQKEALDKFRDEERDVLHKLAIIERDIKPLDEKIAELRKQARQSEQGRARIDLLERMQKLLDAYKQKLKEQQRGTLEAFFNRHLANLLDSNRLIAETKIDDSFQLHYLDTAGAPVAMSSISAGMKQLAATALLWALKDACGRQLPVIIDTPLGRIDKQHQDNLLTRYYPKAAKQVILLPTDSELDERKHRLLEPYIYREFHLHNPDGENTEIHEVTGNKEVRYG
jgi:DNA sulfur modification protein DndD